MPLIPAFPHHEQYCLVRSGMQATNVCHAWRCVGSSGYRGAREDWYALMASHLRLFSRARSYNSFQDLTFFKYYVRWQIQFNVNLSKISNNSSHFKLINFVKKLKFKGFETRTYQSRVRFHQAGFHRSQYRRSHLIQSARKNWILSEISLKIEHFEVICDINIFSVINIFFQPAFALPLASSRSS